jgi:hypothetical protein
VGTRDAEYDRSRPDDSDLHNNVVELFRMVSGKGSHLCAALNLEHSHGIGALQRSVHFAVFR